MNDKLSRSIDCPLRDGLSWDEAWSGPDNGLIFCWERGRLKRQAEPELAKRTEQGELVTLAWKGGTEHIDEVDEPKKGKPQKRFGTLSYLATWQGLRGDDLDIDVTRERSIVCSKTKKVVIFRTSRP